MSICTHDTHETLRADMLLFLSGTTNLRRWGQLLIAECLQCPEGMRSTLAVIVCSICDSGCPTTDCLPVPGTDENQHAHASCLLRVSIETGAARMQAAKVLK